MQQLLKGVLAGIALLALSGCERAEQAAQELAEKAEQAVIEQARESLGETLDQLNQQVDQAQEFADQWLDRAPPADRQAPEEQAPLTQET